MAIANIKEIFPCEVEKVWNLVTSLDNYAWRSDLSKIEKLIPEKKFVEYTKDGYATTFTITEVEPMKRYAFDIENENMQGHWVGLFSYDNQKTRVDFTEDITVKKVLMKPFVGIYLRKQQATYMEDLKSALGYLK
ncbi:SRPBCC family protein [Aminipila sp.]|uniref:SRPBCC family protein n=1 Tax=Aminipila sp. TaxID=2060095 RepID=UPI002897404B|nr:SRPBCC family protein [Aminipila sp.]